MLNRTINARIKISTKDALDQAFLKKEARIRDLTNYEGRKIGHIAKRAITLTILVAFGKRFGRTTNLALPIRAAQGRFGKKTSRTRQTSDNRRRLDSIVGRLNEAYGSGSKSRIRAAERARSKAAEKQRGKAFSPDADTRSLKGLFRAFVMAARQFPAARSQVMAILQEEKNIQITNNKGTIRLGVGNINLLDTIRSPSVTTELGSFTETPFVHLWRQMEFGSGIFAQHQAVAGNLAGGIRGQWWYGPKDKKGKASKSGVEFAGSRAGNIIFQAASVPYQEDAQAFFGKFNELMVEALGE